MTTSQLIRVVSWGQAHAQRQYPGSWIKSCTTITEVAVVASWQEQVASPSPGMNQKTNHEPVQLSSWFVANHKSRIITNHHVFWFRGLTISSSNPSKSAKSHNCPQHNQIILIWVCDQRVICPACLVSSIQYFLQQPINIIANHLNFLLM